MAYIEKGTGSKALATLFAVFAVFAALGMGNMVQTSTIASVCSESFNMSSLAVELILLILIALITKKIFCARLTQYLCPVMSIIYISGCFAVICINGDALPQAIKDIFDGAFSLKAGCGGVSGYAIKTVITNGGIYPDGSLSVCKSFSNALGFVGGKIISVSIILFALATVIGWYFIGEKTYLYIYPKFSRLFRYVFCLCVFIGSVSAISALWTLSDIFNGLMAIPNIICCLLLSKEVKQILKRELKSQPVRDE